MAARATCLPGESFAQGPSATEIPAHRENIEVTRHSSTRESLSGAAEADVSDARTQPIFGHPGFGGQIGWADPATGISFGYLTNGYDRNDLREGGTSVAMRSLAGACGD